MDSSILSFIFLSLKTLSLVGLRLYLIFAFVIVRQEHQMAGVLEEHSEPVLRTLAYVHLLGAFLIFLLGIIILP